jgi:hypothetical protein
VSRRRGCGLDAGGVVVVAARVLAIPPEGILALLGERELTALTTAVAAADEAFAAAGETREPDRVCSAAAALLTALAAGRPFPRDNRAVAVAAALQLLGLHRLEPDPAFLDDLPGVLAGAPDAGELAALLRGWVHVRPSSTRGGFDVEEKMTGGGEGFAAGGFFGRFSNDARAAIVYAQEDARQLGHPIIGTEHVLCGLLHDPETPAGRALARTGITLDAVLAEIQATDRARSGRRGRVKGGHIPFSPRAKKVLELAMREALRLGDAGVGTGHILLGLIREGEGLAAQVLTRLGADLRTLRGVTTGLIEQTTPAPGVADPDGQAVIASVEALVEQRDRVAAERDALQREVERLRTALRVHGIDPDEGGASVSA